MTTLSHRIPIHAALSDQEVLCGAWLRSETDRSRSAEDAHMVRVGVRRGSGIDWMGTWDQRKNELVAGERYQMLGEGDLNFPLSASDLDEVVVEVTRYGSPASIRDVSVTVCIGKAAEVGEVAIERNGEVPARDIRAPIFRQHLWVEDPQARAALDDLIGTLNSSGVTSQSVTVPLSDPPTAAETDTTDKVYVLDRETTGTVVSNTSSMTECYSHEVPGGTLETDRMLRFTAVGFFHNATGVNRTITVRLRFGGTTFYQDVSGGMGNATVPVFLTFCIPNVGASNVQYGWGFASIPGSGATTGNGDFSTDEGVSNAAIGMESAQAIDTTAPQTFDFAVQLSAASASLEYRMRYAVLEVV